jgi:hypothetical protein
LSTGIATQEYSTTQNKNLVVRVADYQLIAGHLYKMGADNILRRYVLENGIPRILVEAHEGIMQVKLPRRRSCAQHYGGQRLKKIQRNTVKHAMYVKG